MAVGDVISQIITGGTDEVVYFQPASGVEVMVTECGHGSVQYIDYYDGTNAVIIGSLPRENAKIFIKNDLYLRYRPASGGSVSSDVIGIQIKGTSEKEYAKRLEEIKTLRGKVYFKGNRIEREEIDVQTGEKIRKTYEVVNSEEVTVKKWNEEKNEYEEEVVGIIWREREVK